MAVDEALLEGDDGWLRLYGWLPHAISIGYFQRRHEFRDLEAEFPIVRRTTGGGAILHASELTFSLALPADALPIEVAASYDLVNEAVRATARRFAVPLSIPQATPAAGRSMWCFATPTGLDLVDPEGRKVFGSAQRRRGGRVLHHASLIIRRHPRTPFTGELGALDERDLRRELATQVARALGREPRITSVPAPVLARAADLVVERYASDAWTSRR